MYNIIRFFSFLLATAKKREAPFTVNFDITTKCNLKCEHCYWLKSSRPKKDFTDSEWEKIFKSYKTKGTSTAFLTGGEPALRLNVIRSAYNVFSSVSIVSNGTIKIPEDIKIRIFVSIDGPEEIHNFIRKKDVFGTVLENIHNDKRVILSPTLTTTNYKYIDEMVEIAKKSNIDGIFFSAYTSQLLKDDPLLLQGEQLEWTVQHLLGLKKRYKKFILMSPYMINLLQTKAHNKNCFMSNQKKVISLDAELKLKTPCVLGENVNCDTCGCIVSLIGHSLSKLDIRSWLLFGKIFPSNL